MEGELLQAKQQIEVNEYSRLTAECVRRGPFPHAAAGAAAVCRQRAQAEAGVGATARRSNSRFQAVHFVIFFRFLFSFAGL
jgi:hypothetical protein